MDQIDLQAVTNLSEQQERVGIKEVKVYAVEDHLLNITQGVFF